MTTVYILTAVIFMLCAVMIVQSVISARERRDLYNRIMSRDIHDYKNAQSPTVRNPKSKASEVLERWRDRPAGGGKG